MELLDSNQNFSPASLNMNKPEELIEIIVLKTFRFSPFW